MAAKLKMEANGGKGMNTVDSRISLLWTEQKCSSSKWLLVTKINISLVYPYSNTVAPNDLLKHLYFGGKVKQRNMRKCTYNKMFNKL